ncbi:MAG: D-alanyl-D-alanine carboxypeptidase [Robiginitomaculum sp.]|nr:D-alanyl-D-alanine carboxypeptidase [Robiginitomaculum sp.]
MIDYPIDPASLTKILTYMVILDCLKAKKTLTGGEFSLDTKLVDIVLVNGEKHIHIHINVDEGLKFLMGRSKNRIASSFAQLIAGSEEAFVEVINLKARQLGLKNSRFINASGLPGHDLANTIHGLKGFSNVSTLEDLSILTIQTSRIYPEYTKYTGRSYKVGDYEFTSVNPLYRKPYRDLAAKYGLNGLKTGTTDNGRSLIATGKLNNHELSIITLGHLHVDENDHLVKERTRPEVALKLFAENERLLNLEDYEVEKKRTPREALTQSLS